MNARQTSLPLLLTLALGACQAVPPGGGAGTGLVPQAEPVLAEAERYRILAIEELPVVAITTDGDQAGFPKARLDDGDLATQWSSATYRAATAWAAVQLAQAAALSAIRVKTGPTPAGTSYDVQVSDDGTAWRTALTGVTTTSWSLERKALPAGTSGKFVRLFWRNNAANPQPRFSIFELAVDGEPGAAPSPVPTATPTSAPTPTPPASTPGPVSKLAIAAASASSSYAGLAPGRAIDGDQATQWAAGGYKEGAPSWTLDLGQARAVDHLRVKTGYLPANVTYGLEHSLDGASWTPSSYGHNNGGWGLVQRPLAVRARYVRLTFANHGPEAIARVPLYEVEAWGRAAATEVTRTVLVQGASHRTIYGGGAGIGGTWQEVIQVEAEAFNDKATGMRFPAMLAMDRGRYGWTYGRITPQNADQWGGDIGGSGAVSFLDTADGLADNAGSWIFTHRDMDDEVYPIEATVTNSLTTWRTDRAASLDLGPTTRRWRINATERRAESDPLATPGAFAVYKRTDGAWDFTQVSGAAAGPLWGPNPIEASGRVWLFYVTSSPEDVCLDLDVTFTALD